jgi:hypothetical protein
MKLSELLCSELTNPASLTKYLDPVKGGRSRWLPNDRVSRRWYGARRRDGHGAGASSPHALFRRRCRRQPPGSRHHHGDRCVAAHARRLVGDPGRNHLGAGLLSDRRRRRHADGRLSGQPVRAQTPLPGRDVRFHPGIDRIGVVGVSGRDGGISLHPGDFRISIAPPVPVLHFRFLFGG